jgi:hypothetical protein
VILHQNAQRVMFSQQNGISHRVGLPFEFKVPIVMIKKIRNTKMIMLTNSQTNRLLGFRLMPVY